MITVKAGDWEGLDGFAEDELRELKPKAYNAMVESGNAFRNELRMVLTGSRSGIPYPASKRGPAHVASAPGEPPGVWTGALRNSMGFSRPRWEGWRLEMEVGSGLGTGGENRSDDARTANAYARRLEYGGFSFHPWPVYIAPRPYMTPTAEKMDPEIQRIFERRL